MNSSITPEQKELVAALASSQASRFPLDLAVTVIMNYRHCSQSEAFGFLRELGPAITMMSETPFVRTRLAAAIDTPQELWKWVLAEV
jgi:hypothetical protein